MDFKKNWSKLLIAAIMTFAAVILLIGALDPSKHVMTNIKDVTAGTAAPKWGASLALTLLFLSGTVFFLGSALILVMKAFEFKKEYTKYILLGIGTLGMIATLVFLFTPVVYDAYALGEAASKGKNLTGLDLLFKAKAFTIAPYVTMIAVFALVPFIKGLNKVFCNCETK